MEERHHGLEDGVEDNLETGNSGHESERTKHSKGSQRLHVEALDGQVGQNGGEEGDDDDDEVEDVPTVPQVGSGMTGEAISDDFEERLPREDHCGREGRWGGDSVGQLKWGNVVEVGGMERGGGGGES